MTQVPATAGKAPPARPRIATGVWRLAAAEKMPAPTMQSEEAAPVALDQVFEEIAALEANFVHPEQQPTPVVAQVEPEPEPEMPAAPSQPPHAPAVLPAEDRTAPNPAHIAAVPQDPLFDFTEPLPAQQESNPFTPAPTVLARHGKRYVLGAAGLLSVALLVFGGRWLYQERNDAGSMARTAAQARVATPANGQAIAEKASLPAPGAEGRAQADVPVSSPVPPLVMLERDPPAAIKPEQALPSVEEAPPVARKPKRTVEKKTASTRPKPIIRKADEPVRTAARPAQERPKREPARQFARATATPVDSPAAPDTSMAALLRACRAHGYHATQCIKRECSVTAYGFACRGR